MDDVEGIVSDDEEVSSAHLDDSSSQHEFLSLKEPMEEYSSIGNGDIVQMTHVESFNSIYIRAIKYDDMYEMLMVDINTRPTKPFIEDDCSTVKGRNVLAKYCGDYSRAIIMDSNCDKVDVRIVDDGWKIQVDKCKHLTTNSKFN